MELKTLFKDLDVSYGKGNRGLTIKGLCIHSQFIVPGDLFIVKKGQKYDGFQFVADAIHSGAVAILTDFYNPLLKGALQIIHPDVKAIEPIIADRFFKSPSKHLFLVGITGTNGKTTTAYLIRHLLSTEKLPCGLISTIEWTMGSSFIPASLTTPDIVMNQKLLRNMVDHKMSSAVMEVTSHALDQNRVAGLDFDVALFTNLSQDHLDYHQTMQEYERTKMKLFAQVNDPTKFIIVNSDDPVSKRISKKSQAQLFTYGIQRKADLQAKEIKTSLEGTQFVVYYKEHAFQIHMSLMGHFNVYNCLAAMSVGIVKGLPISLMQEKIHCFPGVPGRLERIKEAREFYLFVDFAHTEKALQQILTFLSQHKRRKMITVFGCGGERDRDKRPKMGRVVSRFSDQVIVTSDNPRTEDPQRICQEAAAGILKDTNYSIEVDRKCAISKAIEMACREDVVLIAGRGHEPFQKIGNVQIPFDDREVARKICLEKFGFVAV